MPTPDTPYRRPFGAVALVALACCVVAPDEAAAGPFDVYGFGSRAIAMGGAMTAAVDDHTAVYYNPAGLTRRKKIHLGADLLLALPDASITLRTPERSDPALAPEPLTNRSGLGLGVLFPLGGKARERFALGLSLYLPTQDLLTLKLLDPQIPQWALYDALPGKFHLLLGASAEVAPDIHLGIGVQSLADVNGQANLDVGLTNQTLPRRDFDAELVNTFAPTAGVLIHPEALQGISLGLAWRAALDLTFQLPIAFNLGEALDINVGAVGVTLHVPDQWCAGVAWDARALLGVPLLVAFDLTWARWSRAPKPTFDVTIDVTGDLPDALGLTDTLDFTSGQEPDPGFRDTWTPRVGVEADINPHLALRGGYAFRPAALDPQTGYTNTIDTDAHVLSSGVGITLPDPLEIDENPITFELSGQLTLLQAQTFRKDRANDPVGAYDLDGRITTLSFTVRHDF